jgi:hypothetical protein
MKSYYVLHVVCVNIIYIQIMKYNFPLAYENKKKNVNSILKIVRFIRRVL